MRIIVFDTETTSIDKPFCYNIGYVVYDTETEKVLAKRDFVVEQIWHNSPLFESAYYANKRPQYVLAMRGRQTVMDKYGYIQNKMVRDIREYNVQSAYAFNSPFDDKVFEFNSNYYHCKNALDTIPVHDIRGYAIEFLADGNYKMFLDEHEDEIGVDGKKKFITDSDGYKTTAESFYCYLINNVTFDEAHTALNDSEIELAILLECIKRGAKWETDYAVPRCLPRERVKHLTIKHNKQILFETNFIKKTERKTADGISITLKV